jgi:hypothetical protein
VRTSSGERQKHGKRSPVSVYTLPYLHYSPSTPEDFKLSIDLEPEIMAAPSPETRSTLDNALGDLIEY